MKRWILTPLLALACGAFALPAQAVMIGRVSDMNLASSGATLGSDLYNLVGTSFINLHTSVEANANIFKIGNTFYYANTHGIQTSVVGSSIAKTIKSGSALDVMAKKGTLLFISNSTSKSSSYLYDTAKKTVVKLNLAINSVVNVSFTNDGKRMVILGKNSAGKLKLFISTTALQTLKEVALPTGAKTCTFAALSPDGKQLFTSCDFATATAVTTNNGFAVSAVSGSTISGLRKTINKKSVTNGQWISNTKIATIDTAANGGIYLAIRDIADTKVSKTTTVHTYQYLLTDTDVTVTAATEVLADVGSPDVFFMVHAVSMGSTTNSFTGKVMKYNLVSKKSTTLLDDGSFVFMTEAHL